MKLLTKTLISVPVLTAACYAAACAALAFGARSILYHPPGASTGSPTWSLQRDDTRILVSSNQRKADSVVIYFGGNAEDVSQSLPMLEHGFPHASIHALHYRGYSGSGGRPSERLLVADALALYDTLAPEYQHISIVGRSLGTGIATQLAAARRSDRLVLITPYNSILELGQKQFPWFPVRFLLNDQYESWRFAARIQVPTTIIVAGRDAVIPPDSAYRLARQFPQGVADVVTFAEADHSNIGSAPRFIDALAGTYPANDQAL